MTGERKGRGEGKETNLEVFVTFSDVLFCHPVNKVLHVEIVCPQPNAVRRGRDNISMVHLPGKYFRSGTSDGCILISVTVTSQ